jgi:gliding motility-associated lipoprotein GldH
MNFKKNILFYIAAVLILSACDNNRIYEKNKDIPQHLWHKDTLVKFEVDITDTLTPSNFYINVRNADGFPYANLFLFIKTTFPDGKTAQDTIECILADDKGKWLGSGMGDIYDNQILFKRNVVFPQSGIYTFEYRHGMRLENLPLIMDVGLRIEKAK